MRAKSLGPWRFVRQIGVSPLWSAVALVSGGLSGLGQATALLIAVGAAGALAGDNLAQPLQVGPIEFGGGADGRALTIGLVAILLVLLLEVVIAHAIGRIARDTSAKLRRRAYYSYSRAPWSVQGGGHSSDLPQLMTTASLQATQGVTSFVQLLLAASSFLVLIGVAMLAQPIATLAAASTIGLVLLAVRPLSTIAHRMTRERTAVNRSMTRRATERVGAALEIKVFDVAHSYDAEVEAQMAAFDSLQYWSRFLTRLSAGVFRSLALLVVLGAVLVTRELGGGNLPSVAAALLLLIRSLSFAQSAQASYHTMRTASPWLDYFEDQVAPWEASLATELTHSRSSIETLESIELRKVGFAYPGGMPVLENFDLPVQRGSRIGLVGESGAGKTTIAHLLTGLWAPTAGEVLVNGQPVDAADWPAIRRRVAVVPQDSVLLDGSVRDNVRFYRQISDAEVEAALASAGLLEVIHGMADGLDTGLGRRGDALSGGQRQRLAIARALAGQPDLLILDEPTAALDFATEKAVLDTLSRLGPEVAIVLITHRDQPLRLCDQVVSVDELASVASRA